MPQMPEDIWLCLSKKYAFWGYNAYYELSLGLPTKSWDFVLIPNYLIHYKLYEQICMLNPH